MMKLFNLRQHFRESAQADAIQKDKQLLLQEIKTAHQNWVTAQIQFEYALDVDQIEYAIYALEAAEKRYEMLLKQAKKMRVSMFDGRKVMGV
jgi:hypothetical protein